MTRHALCLSLAILLAAATASRAQLFDDLVKKGERPVGGALSVRDRAALDGIMRHMDNEVKRLRDKERIYPDQGFGTAAGDIAERLTRLRQKKFVYGFPKSDVKAYVYPADSSHIFVTENFFKAYEDAFKVDDVRLSAEERLKGEKSTLRKRLNIANKLRQSELGSILIHELVHADKQGVLSTEREKGAYTLQYRVLRFMSDDYEKEYNRLAESEGARPIDNEEKANVLGWLWETGGIDGADKSTESQLKKAKEQLDPQLGITNEQPFPKDMEDKLKAKLPPEPTLPDGPMSDEEYRRQKRGIEVWRDTWMKELAIMREKDPARERNKQDFIRRRNSLGGRALMMACPKCGFQGKHWWLEDRWSCSNCEYCRFPSEVMGQTGANGWSYRYFADMRKRLYDDKRYEIHRRADEMLKRLDKQAGR